MREDSVKTGRKDAIFKLWKETLEEIKHLDLRLLASRTIRKKISVVEITQTVILCYGSSTKLI